MGKFKHNKLRNTGLLFEFLLRQVTVDVLNKEKESSALKIIKKQFNEHTEIGKELALYNFYLDKILLKLQVKESLLKKLY